MKKVIVGSGNPVKLNAVTEAFARVFPNESFEYESCEVSSGVPDQPFGAEETKLGAYTRARGCLDAKPEADFYVGLEGGIEEIGNELWVAAWMCVLGADRTVGYGRSSMFLVPPAIAKLVRAGTELGVATDIVFNDTNSKQKGGLIGPLTNNVITRTDFYRDAVILALIPFLNRELYR